MKNRKGILDKIRPIFEEDGKLSFFKPIFQALDNFLFLSPETTKNPPFGRDPLDVKRFMSLVIIGLFPCFLASLYFFGWRTLLILLVSYIAGGSVEVLFALIRKEEINEGFLVTGFIYPLILPPGLPLWMVAVGIIFGVFIGKEIFGGTGRNIFNPALIGRLFLALGYPAAMTATWVKPGWLPWGKLLSPFTIGTPDAVTSATPLVLAKVGELSSIFNLFVGRVTGSLGETSAIAILLGGIFLVLVGVASFRTVLAILLSFTVFNGLLRLAAPSLVNPVLFSLLSGGILFGAFFMATDPVSSPVTKSGKWIYGIIIGLIAILIRSFSGFVEGVMFAILFGNIFAPIIDEVVIRFKIRRYAREE
ncbi:MAG: RnfABCDGE type electron transport complex subunit D [Spirochaetes bacterium]|nr:RnfABCDGE type electron transport complex subunit D [Spirochaetota bacterium]